MSVETILFALMVSNIFGFAIAGFADVVCGILNGMKMDMDDKTFWTIQNITAVIIFIGLVINSIQTN